MTDVRTPWQFDRAAALSRLDGDDDLLDEILEQFLADVPVLLAAIETGIGRGDGPALRDAAHSLKGAAAYLAADAFCAFAQSLEGFGSTNQIGQARAVWPSFAADANGVVDALRRAVPTARVR